MSDRARVKVAVAGAGGMGREALAWLRDARPDTEPVAFLTSDVTERPTGADVHLPIVGSLDDVRELGAVAVLLGIGENARRRLVRNQVLSVGLMLITVTHPSAFTGPGVTLGEGCLVAPGVILTRDVRIGAGVIVNYGSKVGHDCRIEDDVFLGPGAILTGDVHVGEGAMLGAGVVVTPGVRIGSGATVGAGAVVIRDVPPGVTSIGVPARTVRSKVVDQDLLDRL